MNGGQMISNGRPYEITIQQKLASIMDDSGFEEEERWEDFYTNYAYVNSLSGNERWMAAQVESDQTVRFSLRWHPQLDEVKPKYFIQRLLRYILELEIEENACIRSVH